MIHCERFAMAAEGLREGGRHMATQGIVSVVRGGETVLKCVTGCDGYNAEKLADAIRARGMLTAAEAHALALEVGYGCDRCLVVQDVNGDVYHGDDDLEPRYRATFSDPRFNPRWESGTAHHTVIVDLASPRS